MLQFRAHFSPPLPWSRVLRTTPTLHLYEKISQLHPTHRLYFSSHSKNSTRLLSRFTPITASPLRMNSSMCSTFNTSTNSQPASTLTLAAITSRLNAAQKAAVLAPLPGVSVCTAGPGSGKTRVLAHRVAFLLHSHAVHPSSILALTFTNKAGQEMKARIGALLNNTSVSDQIVVGTFHSFCTRLLRTYGSDVLRELAGSSAVDRDFTIYDRDDSIRIIKNLIQDKKMGSLSPQDVLELISRRKAKEITGQAGGRQKRLAPFAGLSASVFFKPELEVLYRDYTDSLRQSNALDFDDLLLFGWRLLRDYPDIRRQVQRRYQHILVDEYQDTNLPQYEIIRLMYCEQYQYPPYITTNSSSASPLQSLLPPASKHGAVGTVGRTLNATATVEFGNLRNGFSQPAAASAAYNYSTKSAANMSSANRTLFVVGDANQAIYSWRGALPENMNQIQYDYPSIASLYGLKENYRCAPPIAAAANALLGSEVTTSVSVSARPDDKGLREKSVDSPVQIIATKNDTAQAQVITELLKKYAASGKSRAVLYRTNAQSRQLETALLDAHIRYKIIGGLKFYERREVKDIVGYLKLLANPRDMVAAQRTVNTPARGIGPVTQDAFFSWVREEKKKAKERSYVTPTLLDHLHAIMLLSDSDPDCNERDAEYDNYSVDEFDTEQDLMGDEDSDDGGEDDPACLSSSVGELDDLHTPQKSKNGNYENDLEVSQGEEEGEEEEEEDCDSSLRQELAKTCPLTRRELNVLKKYAALIIKFEKYSRRHSLTDLTRHIVTAINMTDHVKKISKDSAEMDDRWENVKELMKGTVKFSSSNLSHTSSNDTSLSYEEHSNTSLSAASAALRKKNMVKFIEHVSLFTSDEGTGDKEEMSDDEEDDQLQQQEQQQHEQQQSDAAAGNREVVRNSSDLVQLMTIHSSKGLEFDVVILSGVEDGYLPLMRRNSLIDNLEEEKRLAYVAMTRAKSDLILTYRKRTLLLKRKSLNQFISKKAEMSRFIKPLLKMEKRDCIFLDNTSDRAVVPE